MTRGWGQFRPSFRPQVGSGRGAAPALWLVRFPGPPSEPDVRVSTHPALHEPMQTSYAVDSNGALDHGEAMLDDR